MLEIRNFIRRKTRPMMICRTHPTASDVPFHGLTARKCPDRSSVCVFSILYGRAPHTPRPARVFPRGEQQRGLETAAPGCFSFFGPRNGPRSGSRGSSRILPPPERGRRSSSREFGEKKEVGMASLAERRPFPVKAFISAVRRTMLVVLFSSRRGSRGSFRTAHHRVPPTQARSRRPSPLRFG